MVGRLMTKSRSNRRGFTLVELLVVVLILAILMGVAIPLYISSVNDSKKKTCRSNMQTIANAVQAARVKANAADYSTFAGSVSTTNEPDLQAAPTAPDGGSFSVVATGTTTDGKTVPTGGFAVQCTYCGSFVPGVDNQ